MQCSAVKVSGNNTGPLFSSVIQNFMSFKWDLRIVMVFESFSPLKKFPLQGTDSKTAEFLIPVSGFPVLETQYLPFHLPCFV